MTTNPTLTPMTIRVVTVRDITPEECPWLRDTVPAGTELFVVSDTYGCCSPAGIAVERAEKGPYFEVPRDAVIGIVE